MRIWEKVTVKKIIHWPWQKEGTQEIFKDYVLCNFLKGFLNTAERFKENLPLGNLSKFE